jgi:hypothetical protein
VFVAFIAKHLVHLSVTTNAAWKFISSASQLIRATPPLSVQTRRAAEATHSRTQRLRESCIKPDHQLPQASLPAP